jgi:hypothetical protein
VALVLAAGVLLPLGIATAWARGTVFESSVFAKRAVTLLDSQTIRRDLADELTAQLARSGNQQAVVFRPALQLAIEAVIDTDTFRSIFRTAVRQAHQAVLEGGSGDGLDLSDSLAIIAGTAQLVPAAQSGDATAGSSGLARSLDDTVDTLADLHVWGLQDTMAELTVVFLGGAALAAAGAVAVAADRRRAVRRLGVAVIVGGLALAGALLLAERLVERAIDDPALARAVGASFARATSDLRGTALWVVGYGIIGVAASARRQDRLTPARVRERIAEGTSRLRRSTGGTVLLGCATVVAGVVVLADPGGAARFAVVGAAFYLVYLGVTEVLGLVRLGLCTSTSGGRGRAPVRWRWGSSPCSCWRGPRAAGSC